MVYGAWTVSRAGILAVLIPLIAGLVFLPRAWNSTRNGPDLGDPSPFVGCYGSGSDRLIITRSRATVVATRKSTSIVRFFYLKTDAAINTVNNLQYDASGNDLRIGGATSGFFYRFDKRSRPSALLIPDDGGNVRTLPRVPC